MDSLLTSQRIMEMVQHWLQVPINGYLGSGYGSNLPDLLQQPMSTPMADVFIEKMLNDIPILRSLPPGSVNVYISDRPGRKDAKDLLIEVLGDVITVNIPSGTVVR